MFDYSFDYLKKIITDNCSCLWHYISGRYGCIWFVTLWTVTREIEHHFTNPVKKSFSNLHSYYTYSETCTISTTDSYVCSVVCALCQWHRQAWGTCPLAFANDQIDIERVVDRFDALAQNRRLALK